MCHFLPLCAVSVDGYYHRYLGHSIRPSFPLSRRWSVCPSKRRYFSVKKYKVSNWNSMGWCTVQCSKSILNMVFIGKFLRIIRNIDFFFVSLVSDGRGCCRSLNVLFKLYDMNSNCYLYLCNPWFQTLHFPHMCAWNIAGLSFSVSMLAKQNL